MNKDFIKKYVVYYGGVLVLGAGIALSDASLLGTDSLSVFVNAFSKMTGVSMGVMNGLVSLIQVAIAYVLDKKTVSISTVISIFACSIGIDAMAMFLPTTSSMVVRVIFMVLGILVYALGCALSQIPQCGYNSYDCFIYGLAKIFKIKDYAILRWIVDGTYLVVGILLGGTAGICTVLTLLVVGKIVEFYLNFFKKINFTC